MLATLRSSGTSGTCSLAMRCRWMLDLNRPDVFAAQPHRDQQPRRDDPKVDGGRATQRQAQPVKHEKALGRDAKQHRADRVCDPADDDVDGRFDLSPLRWASGKSEQVRRWPCRARTEVPDRARWSRGRWQMTRRGGSSSVPVPSAAGSTRIVTARPKRRRAGPTSANCSTKLTAPRAKLKVPKNRVNCRRRRENAARPPGSAGKRSTVW